MLFFKYVTVGRHVIEQTTYGASLLYSLKTINEVWRQSPQLLGKFRNFWKNAIWIIFQAFIKLFERTKLLRFGIQLKKKFFLQHFYAPLYLQIKFKALLIQTLAYLGQVFEVTWVNCKFSCFSIKVSQLSQSQSFLTIVTKWQAILN